MVEIQTKLMLHWHKLMQINFHLGRVIVSVIDTISDQPSPYEVIFRLLVYNLLVRNDSISFVVTAVTAFYSAEIYNKIAIPFLKHSKKTYCNSCLPFSHKSLSGIQTIQ